MKTMIVILRPSDNTYWNAETKVFGPVSTATEFNTEILARQEIGTNALIPSDTYEVRKVHIKTRNRQSL